MVQVRLSPGENDTLIWGLNSNGEFSNKSLCKKLFEERRTPIPDAICGVWKGLVPYCIEVFVWTALLQKVKMKDKLKKMGIVSEEEAMCILCGKEEEEANHLFIHCEVSNDIWQWWLDQWDIAWCSPYSLLDVFSQWQNLVTGNFVKKVWVSSFFVIVWTLWKERNERVFNKVCTSKDELCKLILLRISWWIKGWYPKYPYSPEDVVNKPEILRWEALNKDKKSKRGSEDIWEAPSIGWLKWNVDASINSEACRSGVGGILRDWKGFFRCVFSCPVNHMDINEAEVWAILTALELSLQKEWVLELQICIESDSINAIQWCNKESGGLWRLNFALN